MIISASRRTDIPAFYSEWFINRLKEGFVYVRSPRNPNRISSVTLNRDVVDCIVFWTKNPRPMLKKLETIDRMGYPYYFQVTITPYDHHVERGLPAKSEIMKTFKELSTAIGKHRVIWRYDPVIVSKEFSVPYHLDAFRNMCDILGDYTNKCIFSFIDLYTKVRKSMKEIVDDEVNTLEMKQIAQGFGEIAKVHSLTLGTCAEVVDFSSYGVLHTSCINPAMIENMIGYPIQGKKDPNQRPTCGCIESIDIGAYDSCSHGCVYCYATTSENVVCNNRHLHDPRSPLLLGDLRGDEIIAVREVNSLKVRQSSLF
jgi:hypothetical protein